MKMLSLFCLLTIGTGIVAAEDFANHKGVEIKKNDAIIRMGADYDVNLVRTGPNALLVKADTAVDGKLTVEGKDIMAEISQAKKGPVVHYGDKQFLHCTDSSRRCLETSSIQHGSSREIIISGDQNLDNFELDFFVQGNSYIEITASVMHCGGGCHSDFMDKKFGFNGYMMIRDMNNDGYKDYGGTTGETVFQATGGEGNTGGHWEVVRKITSWNQHGSYSGVMRLRHVKGSYTYGGPYYIRVRSSNHALGLIRHIDEPESTCKFDCAAAGCTETQPAGQACSCYVEGDCPELVWNNADEHLSVCC